MRIDPALQAATVDALAPRVRRRVDALLADRSAFEDFDTAAAAARDYHYVDLYEKAVQHLIG